MGNFDPLLVMNPITFITAGEKGGQLPIVLFLPVGRKSRYNSLPVGRKSRYNSLFS
jgi:hypothetical protein